MVHFFRHYDPEVRVDALEIDPVVVQVADRYFDTRSGGNVNIITADGVRYLAETRERYNVIFMDAFLKPSQDTDATGKPLAMKTQQFYQDLQKKLTDKGLVVFNVNPHQTVRGRLAGHPCGVCPNLRLSHRRHQHHCVGLARRAREDMASLRQRAKELDRRLKTTFSFQDLLRNLAR